MDYLFGSNCQSSLQLPSSWPTLAIVLLSSVLIITIVLWPNAIDPREPQLAPTRIPHVGHIVGFAMHSLQYLEMLRIRTGVGAYTMHIGLYKLYVVCSPSLAQAVLRSPDLSANPLVAKVAPQLMNLGPHVTEVLKNGDFARRSHKFFIERLSQNPSLGKTESAILAGMAAFVNNLGSTTQVPDLMKWLSRSMVLNNSTALYGPGNPIVADLQLIDDMWTYEFNQSKLMIPYFSRLVVPDACAARARLTDAFTQYYEQNHHKEASDIVKARFENAQSFGFSVAESASFDLVLLTVAVVNVIPSLFWMLAHVFSEPNLVQELRRELEQSGLLTKSVSPDKCGKLIAINLSRLNDDTAPLLMSSYREGLRCSNLNMPCREVLNNTLIQDHVTNETYLLKKGTVVLIPIATLHPNISVWGHDADQFDGRRWIKMGHLNKVQKKAMNQGFIPFGGGKHLCPGRHVAQVELLSIAAFLIMGCDVSGLDGNTVAVPEACYDGIRKKPITDLGVIITKRPEFQDATWRFDI